MQPRWGGPHGGVMKECNGSSHHVKKPYSMHMHPPKIRRCNYSKRFSPV